MKIYALVLRKYDWDEAEKFFIVTTKKEKVVNVVDKYNSYRDDLDKVPLLFGDIPEDKEKMVELRMGEETHFCVFVKNEIVKN